MNDPDARDSALWTLATPSAAATGPACWLAACETKAVAEDDSGFVEATAVDELPGGIFSVWLPLLVPTMATTFWSTTGGGLDFVAETMVTKVAGPEAFDVVPTACTTP